MTGVLFRPAPALPANSVMLVRDDTSLFLSHSMAAELSSRHFDEYSKLPPEKVFLNFPKQILSCQIINFPKFFTNEVRAELTASVLKKNRLIRRKKKPFCMYSYNVDLTTYIHYITSSLRSWQ